MKKKLMYTINVYHSLGKNIYLTFKIVNLEKLLPHTDCSTDEKSNSSESRKISSYFLPNQNTNRINFNIESNALTPNNFEMNNKSDAEEFKFNLSQLKIENGNKVYSKEIQAKHNNADITFENNNFNNSENNNLENFNSFANNNINFNKLDITFSNEKFKKEEFSILNSNLVMPNNHIINNNLFESNEKIKKDDNRNLENKESISRDKFANYENNNNQSPKKIGKMINDSIYQKFFSSCKNNKAKGIEISESERKCNLELIDNMNFSISENLLANDSVVISNFNEIEYALENKWERILKEIEESHVVEDSEAEITSQCTLMEENNFNCNNVNNNSHVLGSFDPINHSLNSFYDIHLDKDEYQKFLALEINEKQTWLINYKKDIYDLITNKSTTNLKKQSLLKVKAKKRKTNSNNINNNNLRSLKRKSLLEIHYCHIEFDHNETYDGEKLDVNSTSINGYGVYRYKNGDVYEGDFIEGKRHGLGEYVYSDQSYYRGEWENNCKSGRGVYCKKAKEFNGIWKENNFISGFVFELKNCIVDQRKQEGASLSISNSENYLNFAAEQAENSTYSIKEEYLDIMKIDDFFKDYDDERLNSNFSYGEFLHKYKAIQKEYFSNILMTYYDFFCDLIVDTEIHLNDIIFNQKSIFKKFFNNNLIDNNKQNESMNQSHNELSFSFANQEESLEKLNIEDLIFFSDCPMEETIYDFCKVYKLDFSLKCDCKKIRNFISHFC